MSLRCRLGLHKWGKVVPAVYWPKGEMLCLVQRPAMRACQRCPVDQRLADRAIETRNTIYEVI